MLVCMKIQFSLSLCCINHSTFPLCCFFFHTHSQQCFSYNLKVKINETMIFQVILLISDGIVLSLVVLNKHGRKYFHWLAHCTVADNAEIIKYSNYRWTCFLPVKAISFGICVIVFYINFLIASMTALRTKNSCRKFCNCNIKSNQLFYAIKKDAWNV